MVDTHGEGLASPADLWLLDRLLAVQDDSATAHPELAAWLTAVRRPASAGELAELPTFLRALDARQGSPAPVRFHGTPNVAIAEGAVGTRGPAARRTGTRRRNRRTRVVVLTASALVVIGGTAAAAYTGVLPAPLQSLASHVPGVKPSVAHPVSTPGAGPKASGFTPSAPSTHATVTPGAPGTGTSAAVVSACSDYLAHTLGTGSAEYQALVAAAGKASRLTGYCTSALHATPQSSASAPGKPTISPSNKPSTHPGGKPTSSPTSHGGGKPSTAPTHKPHA